MIFISKFMLISDQSCNLQLLTPKYCWDLWRPLYIESSVWIYSNSMWRWCHRCQQYFGYSGYKISIKLSKKSQLDNAKFWWMPTGVRYLIWSIQLDVIWSIEKETSRLILIEIWSNKHVWIEVYESYCMNHRS